MGLLRRLFDSRIEFAVETVPLPAIQAVPSQMTQVLLNLCLNARDAMPRGGKLMLRTEVVDLPSGEFVRLRRTLQSAVSAIPSSHGKLRECAS